MSSEIQVQYSRNKTLYSTIHNQTSGFIWSTSGGTSGAFTSPVSGDWVNYVISLTEELTTGFYKGNWPSTMGAGVYSVVARDQAGGSATQLDTPVANGDFNWGGTAVLPLSDMATSGQLGQIAPIRLGRGIAVSGFYVYLVSAADHVTPFTSGVCSGQVSRDGGGFGAFQSGTINEVGQGMYKINITSGDILATTAAFLFTATGISGGTSDPRMMSLVLQRVSGQ